MFKKKNKKGWIGYLLTLIVLVAFTAIVGIVSNNIHNEWNQAVQDDDSFPEIAKNESQQYNERISNNFDFFVLIIFIAFTLGAMATAFFAETNPILLGITVLLLISILIIPMLLSNMWEEFITEPEFISLRSDYPVTDFIMTYYAHLFVGVTVLVSLVAFVRFRT